MQRGKASVQHFEGGGQELLKAFEGRRRDVGCAPDAARMAGARQTGESDGEVAGHIVDQLRRAYDELVHEPVPDHLRRLLANLSDTEDKS